jgi:hypothetical protein
MSADPGQAVELMFCALHGVTAGVIGMPEYDWGPANALAGRMMDTLFDGLLRRAAAD